MTFLGTGESPFDCGSAMTRMIIGKLRGKRDDEEERQPIKLLYGNKYAQRIIGQPVFAS